MDDNEKMAEVRAKRKKPVSAWGVSKHREDYTRLIQAGWSSTSLEHYAEYRYKEKIPASTFRNHMARIQKKHGPVTAGAVKGSANENLAHTEIDVMGVRQGLIALQLERIGIDFTHENQMKKLFSGTRQELQLLNQLLDAARQDQVEYGVRASAGEEVPLPTPANGAPKHQSFGQLLGLKPEDDELTAVENLAKVIEMHRPGAQTG